MSQDTKSLVLRLPAAKVESAMASDSATISEGNIISVDGHSALPTHYQPKVPRGPSEFLRYEYPIHNEPAIADTGTADLKLRECTVEALPIENLKKINSSRLDEPIEAVQILELHQNNKEQFRAFLDSIDTQLLDPLGRSECEILDSGQWKLQLPDNVFGPKSKPQISLRGISSPPHIKLFVSIPHFSYGNQHDDAGNGVSLADYRNTAEVQISGLQQVFVHQTCFVSINNNVIAILKTGVSGSEHSSSFPFSPNQHRISSVHLLVHMISTLFRHSAKQVFEHFREGFFNIERAIERLIAETTQVSATGHVNPNTPPPTNSNPATPRAPNPAPGTASTTGNRAESNNRLIIQAHLNALLGGVSAILYLIDSQIKVVEELYEMAQGTFWDPHDPCYNRNVIRLLSSPIHKGKAFQIISAAFEIVLSERRAYAEKFERLKESGRKTQAMMLQVVSEGASETVAKQARTHAQRMIDQAISLEETMKGQGQVARAQAKMHAETMSLFTVVTTIFLPLSFLASYYALDPGKRQVQTFGDFWKPSGVVTVVFVLFTLCVVYRKKHDSGEDTAVWALLKNLKHPKYRGRQREDGEERAMTLDRG